MLHLRGAGVDGGAGRRGQHDPPDCGERGAPLPQHSLWGQGHHQAGAQVAPLFTEHAWEWIRSLGSLALTQLAFHGESDLNFPVRKVPMGWWSYNFFFLMKIACDCWNCYEDAVASRCALKVLFIIIITVYSIHRAHYFSHLVNVYYQVLSSVSSDPFVGETFLAYNKA